MEEKEMNGTQKTNIGETKKCKHCQTDIPKKARICQVCKKKQQPSGCLMIILAVVLIGIIGSVIGGGDDKDKTTTATTETASEATTDDVTATTEVKEEVKEEEKVIEYTAYNVSEMMDDLKANALKAESKYADQYVEITGKLSNIDSSGKYISLVSDADDFAIIGVQCYINNDDQTNKVMEMVVGDSITITGKVSDVGEVMGYSLDIDEIK